MTGSAPPSGKTASIGSTRLRKAPPPGASGFACLEQAGADTLFGAIVAAAPEGILVQNAEGRIVIANTRAEHLFGYAPDELSGQPVEALLPDHLRAAYPAVPSTRPIAIGSELTGRRKDGSEFPAAVSLSSLEREGGPLVVAVVRDVTREREIDRLKDEFVATVSHELRTPLTSIVGFVDLLLAGDAGPLSDTARRYLEIVVGNGERLTAIINDLLDVSRLEAGKIKLNRTPLDLARAAENVAAGFGPQIAAKGQTLRLDLPADLPRAWADPERIAQVLANLVSNAHKYTPEGGTITVAIRREDELLHVSVADTGVGLSADERARLFTKFYRVDKSASRQAGGTGLGLAITRALVELHGGTIGVESAPGRGSTFSFTLPLESVGAVTAITEGPGPRSDLLPTDNATE
jgi:PAS domain S-box-containing protein